MSIEEQIKEIKTAHSNSVINKAKAEERKKSFLDQKAEIEKQCAAIGVKPEELATKKDEKLKEIEANMAKAREMLGMQAAEVNDDDTPF